VIRFLSDPALLTLRMRSMSVAAAVFFLVIETSCVTRHVPSPTAFSFKYRPIKIAVDIETQPGCVAWANDGRTLAFVRKGTVNLYDAESAEVRSIRLDGAHSVAWSPEDALLVLAKENGKDILCTIDRKNLEISRTPVDAGAESVYAANDNRHLLLLAKRLRRLTFGIEVALRVSLYEINAGAPKTLYEFTKIYPVDKPDRRTLSAWTHAGLRPVDNSLLVIEYIRPPAVAPYSRVIMIDSVSGETTEISGRMHTTVYTSASWSPAGNMIALTTGDGGLEIRAVSDGRQVQYGQATGFYPTWSPGGDRVYTGGHLVAKDGTEPEMLLANAAWSVAQWSPDGTTLAVAAEGALWLFRDMGPALGRPDGDRDRLMKKMQLLQELFRNGLITPREYQERKDTMMKRTEGE